MSSTGPPNFSPPDDLAKKLQTFVREAQTAEEGSKDMIEKYNSSRPSLAKNDFFVPKSVWLPLCYAIDNNISAIVLGPSGQGKSTLVELAAKVLGKQFSRYNFGAMEDARTCLMGTREAAEARTYFSQAQFVTDIQTENNVMLWDEATRSSLEAQNILLPLLCDQRELRIDMSSEPLVVRRHSKCSIVATGNQGVIYRGTQELDNAFSERFPVRIYLNYPSVNVEKDIITSRMTRLFGKMSVPATIVESLCKLASLQRAYVSSNQMDKHISTRMLIETARCLNVGMPLSLAVEVCILNHFSRDGGETSDVEQIKSIGVKEKLWKA